MFIILIKSINYFGDIVAETEFTCLFISGKDFQRIPLYELEKLRDYSIRRLDQIKFLANRKYGVSIEGLSEY
jgi:hypothetical protein